MKKSIILATIALTSFISLSAHAAGFDKKSAEAGVLAGMYLQKNMSDIVSWSRLIAYKTLKAEAGKYDCNHLPTPSKNGASEYIRGLCTYVNQKNKQEVLEGLNALSFAVLHAYEDKKAESLCAASLAFFTSENYKAAAKLANMSKKFDNDSQLCKAAQNIVSLGVRYEMKYHGKLEPGNVCVGQ